MKYRLAKFVLRTTNSVLARKGLNVCLILSEGKHINYWTSYKNKDTWVSDVNAVIDLINGRTKRH